MEFQEQTVRVERKPFHQTIIIVIKSASQVDLKVLGILLLMTRIPEGHDEIAVAWRQRAEHLGVSEEHILQVTESVLANKGEVAAQKRADEDSMAQALLDS